MLTAFKSLTSVVVAIFILIAIGRVSAQTPEPAHLVVRLVPNAQLELEGTPMKKTKDAVRYFDSPPLNPGENYRYSLKASWTQNGISLSKSSTVAIRAGQTVQVDLTTPDAPLASTAKRDEPMVPLEKSKPLPDVGAAPVASKPKAEPENEPNTKTGPAKEPTAKAPAPEPKKDSPPVDPPKRLGTFSAQPASDKVEIERGKSGSIALNIQRKNFTGAIEWTLVEKPGSWKGSSGTIPGLESKASIPIQTYAAAPPGLAVASLVTRSGSLEHKATFQVLVKELGPTISFAPIPNMEVMAGRAAKLKLTLNIGELKDRLYVEFAGLPDGLSAVVASPIQAEKGQASTVVEAAIQSTGKTAPGLKTIKVVARSGSATVEKSFTLNVLKAIEPTLTLSLPAAISAKPGDSPTVDIGLSRADFSGPVDVTLEDPSGAIAPVLVKAAAEKNAVSAAVVLKSGLKAGAYKLQVRATGGGASASGSIPLSVATPAAPFAVSTPAALNLQVAGFNKSLPISVIRSGVEGPVVVSFENVPDQVTIKPTTIPADQSRVYVEATVGPDADVLEKEVKVVATGKNAKAEFKLKVIVTKR